MKNLTVTFYDRHVEFIKRCLGIDLPANQIIVLDDDTYAKIGRYSEKVEVSECAKGENGSPSIDGDGYIAMEIIDILTVKQM